MIHRDLKPGNIFLTEQNDIKHFVKVNQIILCDDALQIGDFGIAIDADNTKDSMSDGTLGYRAPEGKAMKANGLYLCFTTFNFSINRHVQPWFYF